MRKSKTPLPSVSFDALTETSLDGRPLESFSRGPSHGEKVKAGWAKKKAERDATGEDISKALNKIVQTEKRIVKRSGGKVSNEQYQDALLKLAQGATMDMVTQELGLSRAALWVRAHVDPDFNVALNKALMMMSYAQLEIAESCLMGGTFSTGDVIRDKAIAEHFRWKISKLFRERFADRSMIEAATLNITIDSGMDKLI